MPVNDLKNLGYDIVISNNLYKSDKGRSSSAQNRANEINDMFKSSIDFILCASGGEFLVEILPFVEFDLIKKIILSLLQDFLIQLDFYM